MYINSTTEKLSQKTAKHRRYDKSYLYKPHKSLKHHPNSMTPFAEFGVENCKMFLIEECLYQHRKQLEKKEGEYIENDKSRLSGCFVGRT